MNRLAICALLPYLAVCSQASAQTLAVPSLSVAPSVLNFQAGEHGLQPPPQSLQIGGTQGTAWTATAATSTGGAWLSVSPGAGQVMAAIWVQVNPPLMAGTYQGSITVQAPGATPPSITVGVSLSVSTAEYGLNASPAALYFSVQQGGPPQSQSVGISGGFSWTATAATSAPRAWLTVTSGVFLTATVNAAGLQPGTYQGTITVQAPSAAPTSIAIDVGLTVVVAQGCQAGASPPPSGGVWTWMGGSNLANQPGTYGTKGTPAQSSFPGARRLPVSWTDAAGNFWLFGGFGYDSAGTAGYLNDLWKYTGEWTWMGGGNLATTDGVIGVPFGVNHPGTYGTQGTPSASNVPGPRLGAATWTDAAGSFWLFGGYGPDSAGTCCLLNDMWRYSAGEWTWMGGPNLANITGVPGSPGAPGAFNVPGPRWQPATWTDAAGNLWLFGGNGQDVVGTQGVLGDLWEYSAGQWAWMGGYDVVDTRAPGIPNYPGPTWGAVSWTDLCERFWLYGGLGQVGSSNTAAGWDYQWSYYMGEWTIAPFGSGLMDAPATSNYPGARSYPASWRAPGGNLYVFGGEGYNTQGTLWYLDDMWEYSAGAWTWMGGPSAGNQQGVYGTLGTPGGGNVPGGRGQAVTWIDAAGALWLFGGLGYDSAGKFGVLNDLWRYSAVSSLPAPTIDAGGVVPADSKVPTIQSGEWVSIYGTNLASSTVTWNGNFPWSLGGTSVTIDGKAAYLSFVSPNQINLQAPDDTAAGPVPVVVTTASGSATTTVTLAQFGPSFLLLDAKHVAGLILRSNGSGAYGRGTYDIIGPTGNSLGYPTVAAKAGDIIELFAVGLGPTIPAVPAGQAYSSAAATTNRVNLLVNNVSVTPGFAGLSGAGLYQINLTVPVGLGTGDISLAAAVGGAQTPAGVVISLQ